MKMYLTIYKLFPKKNSHKVNNLGFTILVGTFGPHNLDLPHSHMQTQFIQSSVACVFVLLPPPNGRLQKLKLLSFLHYLPTKIKVSGEERAM